ncbi:unnamed protein product [Amoebophrya sp. A25]|nr:unnamed protein product [Amoebophrya sp. A25]|eukprot:GSA25T00014230001.1
MKTMSDFPNMQLSRRLTVVKVLVLASTAAALRVVAGRALPSVPVASASPPDSSQRSASLEWRGPSPSLIERLVSEFNKNVRQTAHPARLKRDFQTLFALRD